MIPDLEPELLGHRSLPIFNAGIHELFDPAAVQTHYVVVVSPMVQLENRHSVFKVVPGDQARRLELREHAVHRGEADVLVGLEQ
jgi:hypothetical protein